MIQLHMHTSYSLWDGFGDVEDYADMKDKAVFALTEHNNMYSYLKFKNAGYNVYPGVELGIMSNNHHITLLAKTLKGYTRLLELVNIPMRERFLDVIFDENYKDDILYLSGCVKTYFNSEERYAQLHELKKKGFDIYTEIVLYPGFEEIAHFLKQQADAYHHEFVFTNDVHFKNVEHWIYNDIVSCINSKRRFNDADRFRMDTGSYFMNEDEFVEKSELFGFTKEDAYRSFKTAEKIVAKLYNDIPQVTLTVPGYDGNFYAYVQANQIRHVDPTRLQQEMDLIVRKGFDKFFVLTNEVIKLIRELGIITNYGRGSAASSLVAYSLGITHVDPIKYNLSIDRFINEARDDLPDIDIDIPSSKRDTVEQVIKTLWGDDVTRVKAFPRYSERSIASDLARVFEVDYEMRDVNVVEFMLEHNMLQYYQALLGKPRYLGTHASGLCFGDNIAKVFPVLDMEDASKMGLVKLDLLGIKTLDVVQDFCVKHNKNWIMDFDPADYKFDIDKIGTAGVFQLEADATDMVSLFVKPTNITELINVISLSRAPSLKNEAHKRYVNGSSNETLKQLFPDTNGVVIFQEQVLEIFKKYGSFTPQEVESARRAISKFDRNKFFEIMKTFEERADQLERYDKLVLWTEIENSIEYLFNKAHATAYACLSALTMYLKENYYLDFIVSFINNIDDEMRRMKLIAEAKSRGVQVHLPKIVLADEYIEQRQKGNQYAYVKDSAIYITDAEFKFRARTDVAKILSEYVGKMQHPKKIFRYYPFRLHKEINAYKKRYIYCPLGISASTYTTVAYVVNYSIDKGKVWLTDGYELQMFYVRDETVWEIIRNAEKLKSTIVVRIEKLGTHVPVVTKAKTLGGVMDA